jgi:hypothetical protein
MCLMSSNVFIRPSCIFFYKYFKWNQILLKIWHVPNVIKCIHYIPSCIFFFHFTNSNNFYFMIIHQHNGFSTINFLTTKTILISTKHEKSKQSLKSMNPSTNPYLEEIIIMYFTNRSRSYIYMLLTTLLLLFLKILLDHSSTSYNKIGYDLSYDSNNTPYYYNPLLVLILILT